MLVVARGFSARPLGHGFPRVTWIFGNGFGTWISGHGFPDMDFRTWISGQGFPDVDFRTWISERGFPDMDLQTGISGHGVPDEDLRTLIVRHGFRSGFQSGFLNGFRSGFRSGFLVIFFWSRFKRFRNPREIHFQIQCEIHLGFLGGKNVWFVALGSRSRPLHRATRAQPKQPSVASSWEICVPALGKLIRGSTWQTDIKHTADTRQDRGRHTAGTGQDDGWFTAAMVGSLAGPCSSKQHVLTL